MNRVRLAVASLTATAVVVTSLVVFSSHTTSHVRTAAPSTHASQTPSASPSKSVLKDIKKLYVSKQIHHAVSKPLREIKGVLTSVKKDNYLAEKLEKKRESALPNPKKNAVKVVDPVVQSVIPAANPPAGGGGGGGGGQGGGGLTGMPTATGFNGISDGQNGFTVNSAPPDTNMDVGLTQIVEVVNSALVVLSKTGTVLKGPVDLNTLWQGFGGACEAYNDGDPTVAYDRLANRWIISQFAVSQNNSGYVTPYLQCVAVSQTSDAMGAYNEYSFGYNFFPDYPKLSVWPDSYYTTFNGFSADLSSWAGSFICAYDRAKMIANQAATQQCTAGDLNHGGVLVASIDGTTSPTPGTPAYAVAMDSQSTMATWRITTVWGGSKSMTLSSMNAIPIASYGYACPDVQDWTCVPQKNTTTTLDTLGDRMMYRFVYRKIGSQESFVASQTVDVSGITSVRWYELRPDGSSLSVYQSSTFNPDKTHRWMPSIAMDRVGNIATLYSTSSTKAKPSVAIAGRLSTDTLGLLARGESVVKTGKGAQTGDLTRWGDYSALVVDPSDDCTFWGATEYLEQDGSFNWSTWITKFKFSTCVAPPTVSSITGSGAVGSTITITGTSLTGATRVKIGGVGASSVSVKSDTSVTAVVAPGTTGGTVWISTPGGETTSSGSFAVSPSVTSVTAVSPSSTTSVASGGAVTLTGSNLDQVTAVTIDGQQATNFTATASNLYFAVPPSVTTGSKSIVLTTPNGPVTAPSTLKIVSGTTTPTISKLSVSKGPVAGSVTLTGKNLASASAVKFGVTNATFRVLNATTIAVAVPNMAAGSTSITVTTSAGTSTGSTFTVQSATATATITGVSMTSATVGNWVTVTGTNLLTVTGITFGGITVGTFKIISDTQVAFVVPVGASSGSFTITPYGSPVTYSGTITIY